MFYAVTVNAKYVITAYKMQIFVVFWQTWKLLHSKSMKMIKGRPDSFKNLEP
jgi:hypothetical protein